MIGELELMKMVLMLVQERLEGFLADETADQYALLKLAAVAGSLQAVRQHMIEAQCLLQPKD